jgi:hypothetical protein
MAVRTKIYGGIEWLFFFLHFPRLILDQLDHAVQDAIRLMLNFPGLATALMEALVDIDGLGLTPLW